MSPVDCIRPSAVLSRACWINSTAENLKAKGMKIFRDKFSLLICARTSMSDFGNKGWMVNIPLYGMGAFPFVNSNEN